MPLPTYTIATLPANPADRQLVLVMDGDNGAPCIAVSFDGRWIRVEPMLGGPISNQPAEARVIQ